MTPDEQKTRQARAKKVRLWLALAGAVAGLICASLPTEYQAVCHAIANACTGGY